MTVTISDPATAIAQAALQALTAYFNFLATPEGQAFAKDGRQLIWDRLVALLPDQTQAPQPPKA